MESWGLWDATEGLGEDDVFGDGPKPLEWKRDAEKEQELAASIEKERLRRAAEFSWVRVVDEDGNLDQLPRHFDPPTGCPECQAVWTHLAMVGFHPSPVHGGVFDSGRWMVQPGPSPLAHVESVRIVCFGGHHYDFDGVRFTKFTLFPAGIGIMGLAMYAILYSMSNRRC